MLLPSTLGAAFGSLMAAAWVADALRRDQHTGAAMTLVAALAAGWFALATTWRLYYRLLRKNPAFDHGIAWCGLAGGAVVCIGLIVITNGTLAFRLGFFGWPLIAVAFFAAALWRLSRAAAAAP